MAELFFKIRFGMSNFFSDVRYYTKRVIQVISEFFQHPKIYLVRKGIKNTSRKLIKNARDNVHNWQDRLSSGEGFGIEE